ncbi:hypothetical protein UlMin_027619 [Ulmus minor]
MTLPPITACVGLKLGVLSSNAVYHFGTSGLSVAVVTGLTHPLDVLKVRLQMQLVCSLWVLRLGLYEPSTYACDWAFGSTNIFFKITSGGFGGSFAIALMNPIEVLKRERTRTNQYGFFSSKNYDTRRGLGLAMARAAALTASQLATNDEYKRILVRWTPLEEGFNLHLFYLFT